MLRYARYSQLALSRLLRASMILFALTATVDRSQAQFAAREVINVIGSGNVPTETDYIPNVVKSENGLASYEALKAQAVAARTYAYYKMNLDGFIADGTIDQVYTSPGNPLPIHFQAAADTEGEILAIENFSSNQVLIAAFYVAGAIPSGPFDPQNPSARPNPGDSDPFNTERFVTYTYEEGLFAGFNTGTPLGFQGIPTNPNWPNRGGMSQNGGDFLSDNSISYVDILKYYYGADIQLRTASTQGSVIEFDTKVITDFDDYGDRFGATFDGHEGYFNRSPTFSGSTTTNIAGSTATRTTAESHLGSHSQLINIVYDETSNDDFLLRHVAAARFSDFGGSSNVSSTVANLQFESTGSVGFWLKTDDEGLSVTLAIDDPTTGDRGRIQTVIADGQWRKYEWFLERDEDWEPWVGGNGQIDGSLVTIDSIQFLGSGDAQVYLDTVFWNPTAEFENRLVGDFNSDGVVDGADYTVWRNLLGSTGNGLVADGNDDGVVDQLDYDLWRGNFGSLVNANLVTANLAVPEPSSIALSLQILSMVLLMFSPIFRPFVPSARIQ